MDGRRVCPGPSTKKYEWRSFRANYFFAMSSEACRNKILELIWCVFFTARIFFVLRFSKNILRLEISLFISICSHLPRWCGLEESLLMFGYTCLDKIWSIYSIFETIHQIGLISCSQHHDFFNCNFVHYGLQRCLVISIIFLYFHGDIIARFAPEYAYTRVGMHSHIASKVHQTGIPKL